MLALYFDGQPALKDLPRPAPGDGEVLVRVHLAGICGTDLAVLKGYHNFRGIMGHEFVGEVAGPADSPWLGQRVVGEINIGCETCERCRAGLARHCRQRRVLGLLNHDGAFAPYLTLPAANLHAVPPEVPDVWAVFTEPLAAALRVPELAPVSPAARVLVVGDGSLGLQIAWVLALSGAEIHLAGHHPEHLALARPRGVATFLAADLPAGDYDIVVEASGSPSGLELALTRVRPLGTVVLKSTYTNRYPLEPSALVVPEVRLVGSRCGPFAGALRLLKDGRIDPRPLISRTFPLARGLEALDWARRPGVLKVHLDCREGN
ncbi:MAG: alcohol dehydrogenase catalytic domain-containing protein [Syntrophobacterales bacterium]|jgi:threonine dehydrogenase-like Zn-dependent dehydrogenase|nr:alcohol dehydrogenase catalytic domain-containing protein [Syntrophobacterales bacterium]